MQSEEHPDVEALLSSILAAPCPDLDPLLEQKSNTVQEEWVKANLPDGETLYEHYRNKRFHEVFLDVEKLVRREGTSVKEAMEVLIRVLEPELEYYNARLLLNLIVDVSMRSTDGLTGLKFLDIWKKLCNTPPADNKVLYKANVVWHMLRLGHRDASETLIEEIKPVVEHGFGLKASTEAVYYRVLTELHHLRGDYSKVYKYGMYHLKNSMDVSDLNAKPLEPNERELAELLCKASLLAPDVYSFTELLQEPVIKKLSTEGGCKWRDLVVICNSGDFTMYELYAEKNDLSGINLEILQSKLRSFALLEVAFKKSADERVLAFEEIAQVCKIPMSAVEPTVLKLMRRGLLKGSIDALDRIVTFNYLQPRILDQAKLLAMAQQFAHWTTQIQNAHDQICKMAPNLLESAKTF